MKRLSPAVACLLFALPALVASAQYAPPTYNDSDAAYGGGMPQGAYNAPMPQGYYSGPMQGGYAGGPGAYGPQQGYPQGGYPGGPQGAYAGGPQGYPPQGFGPQGPQGMYGSPDPNGGGMPQHMSGRAPKVKLPPGVKAENGLLYYNGNAYADVNYQQFPAGNYPVRQAMYDQGVQSGMGPGRMGSAMSPNGAIPNGGMMFGGAQTMNAGAQSMYGGGPMQDGGMGYGDDGGCDDGSCGPGPGNCGPCNDAAFDVFGRPRNRANLFPGKVGWNWSAGFDALGMNRTAGTDRVLVQNTDTLGTLLNSNEIHFDMTPGGRAFLQLQGPSGLAAQVVYMRLATFVGDVTVNGDNNLQIPFPLASNLIDWFGADQMQFHYTSEIQGGEINALRPIGNFQFIAGYRWLQLKESLRIRALDIQDGFQSDWTTDSFNQMHYGQFGIMGKWQLFGLIDFDFWAKYGIGGDICFEHQVIRDVDNSVIARDTRGNDSGFTYCSELGVQLVLPLNATFSLHGGYDVFILNRIALAPDQLDFNTNALAGTQVQQAGDLVLHGCNFGITAVW